MASKNTINIEINIKKENILDVEENLRLGNFKFVDKTECSKYMLIERNAIKNKVKAYEINKKCFNLFELDNVISFQKCNRYIEINIKKECNEKNIRLVTYDSVAETASKYEYTGFYRINSNTVINTKEVIKLSPSLVRGCYDVVLSDKTTHTITKTYLGKLKDYFEL